MYIENDNSYNLKKKLRDENESLYCRTKIRHAR